ncbi:MAG: N-acetylmuramoyl-L-alanine amidase [Polyangiaceae bacterium]|nr:N-acetylmuramoyl-L-alanine amidase [Polyangiaceae bacterium]
MPVSVWRGLPSLLLLLASACGDGEISASAPSPTSSPASASVASLELAPRGQVLAEANRLSAQAAKDPGRAGAAASLQAARLRERMWRLEHREADALEALALYDEVAGRDSALACQAQVDAARLRGEAKNEPLVAYSGAYLARGKSDNAQCIARAELLIQALSAFRPGQSEIAALDREIQASRGSRAAAVGSAQDPQLASPAPVMPVVDPVASGPATISRVERYGAKDAARVVVFLTRPVLFEVGSLAGSPGQGPRLYVDVSGAFFSGPSEYKVGGVVQRVRLGKRQQGTRIVLDLDTTVYQHVFYLPEPFRLVIDVSLKPPKVATTAPKGPRKVRRIVLDPGHGGNDPGATGPVGLREKDVALDIAHRAAPLLARELGISTLLTRDADVYVPLDERVAKANAFGADVFVSIHCNASPHRKSHGIMTFVLDASKDAAAARIAARENKASAAAAAEFATMMSRVLDAGSVARSSHLADLLQRAAMASVSPDYSGVHDGGVRKAGFYVLAGARMPAVLFEASFISNPTEERRLDTGEYRQKMADAIVNAIRAYRDGI